MVVTTQPQLFDITLYIGVNGVHELHEHAELAVRGPSRVEPSDVDLH